MHAETEDETKEEYENRRFQECLKAMSKSRKKFVEAKMKELDLTHAMHLLNNARELLKKKKYDESMAEAERGFNEVSILLKEKECV